MVATGLALSLLISASSLLATAPAGADPTGRPARPLLHDGRTGRGLIQAPSDALVDVPATSAGYDQWRATRDRIRDQIAALNAQRGDAASRVTALVDEVAGQSARAASDDEAIARLGAAIDAVDVDVRRIAVGAYTGAGGGSAADLDGHLVPSIDAVLRHRLSTEAVEVLGARRRSFTQDRSARQHDRDAAIARRDAATDEQRRQQSDLESTGHAIASLSPDLERAEDQLAAERSNTVVAGTDLPFTALDAYWRATHEVARGAPNPETCGLPWWVLAGIGRMESHHGDGAGGLAADGSITERIIGPALDGVAYRLIPDSDQGVLDGDVLVDHAVGPMQFLPGTWRTSGVDLSGDGVADPFNLYDAALAAARYLCRSGPFDDEGLLDDATVRAAVRRYNDSDSYVEQVMAWAESYRVAASGTPP